MDTVGEADILSTSQINRYLRSSCSDTIGSNKYCHMTFLGKTPSKKDLSDPDYIDEVFSSAHNDRKSTLTSKIQGLMQEFDKEAKDKCVQAITQCAMRTCGGGSGAACYSQVFSSAGENTINGNATYEEIKTGCSAIANTDPNCQYAFESVKNADYSYAYVQEDAFTTLFPKKAAGSNDPIGVVAGLNSSLSLNYNDAAIAGMKKQCQAVATGCVKSLCGADYVNCYRNRTDIYSNLTNTGETSFDKSMNKVGGVLDYTIVLGLCVDTVKNAPICEEHLAIERAKYKKSDNTTAGWGSATDTRSGWYDAGSAVTVTHDDTEEVDELDENGNKLCSAYNGQIGVCHTTAQISETETITFTEPRKISYTTYVQSQAAQSLFKDLIYDLEKEAQAKYNAKLTKQQNDCIAANNGGIMGNKDIASTYMWAKLKNNKVPTSYPSSGLKPNQFVASNELYGSFCRIRISLQSDDKYIQDAIAKGTDWATTYFAAGDAFTCGSWIPNEKLQEIAANVGEAARADAEAAQPKIKGWMTALGAVGLGAGGAFLGDAIQDGTAFTGLLDKKNVKKEKSNAETDANKCANYASQARSAVSYADASSTVGSSISAAQRLLSKYKVENSSSVMDEYNTKRNDWETKVGEYKTALEAASKTTATDAQKNALPGATTAATNAATALKTAISSIETLCYQIEYSEDETDKNTWQKHGGTILGATLGTVGGGLLGYYITDSVQNAQLDKAEQEAIKEFMDNVGSKIHCYIGSDEVGTFGDVISTSME